MPALKKVIVIGGGIGGLTLAIALQRRGFAVQVFERAREIQPVGAGIVLAINAMRVMRSLGLDEAILKSGRQIRRTELRSSSGACLGIQDLGEFSQRYGGISVALHRANLHQCLSEALAPKTLVLGEELKGLEQSGGGAIAIFQSGRRELAECIVCADGLNSVARTLLFPAEGSPRYAGYTCWRGVCNVAQVATTMTIDAVSETWGRGARFGIVPIDAGRIYWFATLNAARQSHTAAETKGILRNTFGNWHAPIGNLIEASDSSSILHHDILDRPPVSTWTKGRVILLGDAIHPTTPNMGQGAAMAIESAAVLAAALEREETLESAYRVYEKARQPRTRWVTEQSWSFGKLGQIENGFVRFLRDWMMRVTPAFILSRPLHRLFSHDCLAEMKHE